MGSSQKMPPAEVPIGHFRTPFIIIEGDLLRINIVQYPYWTKIKIIKLNENGHI